MYICILKMARIFLLSILVLITLLLSFNSTNGEYLKRSDSDFRLLKPEFDDSNIKEFYCIDQHNSDDNSLKTRICIIDLFGWELVALGNAIVAFISGAGGLDINGPNTETNSDMTRNNWGNYSSPEVLSQMIQHGQTLKGRSQKLLDMGNRYQSASKKISGIINKLKDTELKVVGAAVKDFNIVGLDLIELSKDHGLIASEILDDSKKKVHEFVKIAEHMKKTNLMLVKTGNTLMRVADDLWELRGDARNILPTVMDDISNSELWLVSFL